MPKLVVPAIAGGTALALVASVGIATALQKNDAVSYTHLTLPTNREV